MILAKVDIGIGQRYASLAQTVGADARWAMIEAEYHRTVAWLLRVTGRDRLLDGAPVLQRSITLRNPYVDALSEVQVRLLRRLRALAPDAPDRALHQRLVQLSVNGVAAGLQNTG
jgi:phosphoenolpyruvate carboxylase